MPSNRSIFDIMNDLQMLKDVCAEWTEYKKMLYACILKFNIDKIELCDCQNNPNELERLQCSKCNGTGYIIKLKKKSNKKENNKEDI